MLNFDINQILISQNQALKCSILRWFLMDYLEPNPNIIRLLEKCLSDNNWEVRLTAMLIATRYNLTDLALKIKRVELPRESDCGLNRDERSIIREMQQACLAILSGQETPHQKDWSESVKDEKIKQLYQCVAGVKIDQFDKISLLYHALTIPMYLENVFEDDENEHFIINKSGLFLKKTGIEFIYIPISDYWLGYEGTDNPIRKVKLNSGFLISKYPVFNEDFIHSSTDEITDDDFLKKEAYQYFKSVEAQNYCNKLSKIEGLKIEIPDTDLWEISARGETGRLYPWGNSFFKGMLNEASPFGAKILTGVVPQWLIKEHDEKVFYQTGGSKKLMRVYEKELIVDKETKCCLRLLINL